MSAITANVLSNAYTYESFIALSTALFAEGKTTGPNQDEFHVQISGLNLKRISRLVKTTKLLGSTLTTLQNITEPQVWLVITEAWCGDAAQILPVIHMMAKAQPLVELKIILRDENPVIMDEYLTNGARAIPVLVVLRKSDLTVLDHWEPRPKVAQELVMAYKANSETPYEEFHLKLQGWYNKDKTVSIQEEVVEMLGAMSLT